MLVRTSLLNVCLGFAVMAIGCKSEESPGARSVDDEDMQESTDESMRQTSTTSPDTGREAGRAETEETTTPSETTTASLNDGEIAGVLSAANQKEIEVSKMVMSRTKNANVKSYASMMVKHHQQALDKMNAMMTKTGLSVETSDKANELRQSSTQAAEELGNLSGAELDRAYVTMMVEDHRKVLDFIDNDALPNVDDDQLKTLVTELRPVIETHFQQANDLDAKLGEAGQSKPQMKQQMPKQQQPGQQQPGQQKPGQQQPGT